MSSRFLLPFYIEMKIPIGQDCGAKYSSTDTTNTRQCEMSAKFVVAQ